MKRNEDNVDAVLGKVLHSTPQQEMEVVGMRVLQRLRATPLRDEEETPPPTRTWRWNRFAFGLGAVAAAVMIVVFLAMPRGIEAYAAVETPDGSRSETKVEPGEIVRTHNGYGSLTLLDSQVEMSEQSELSWEQASDGVRIHLNKGSVIVNAQPGTGRLYVHTKNEIVALGMGSVFLVMVEELGSRVAVIQGEALVQQDKSEKRLGTGEQLVTNPRMVSVEIRNAISWSRNAAALLALLPQAPTPITPKRLEFEVVSIKPEASIAGPASAPLIGLECQGVDGRILRSPVPVGGAGLGRCVGRRVTLMTLLGAAYDLQESDWVNSLKAGHPWPQWINDPYENGLQIEAKAENPATATKEQLQQMLRTMLEDRFKLKLSWLPSETEGYFLSVTKDGHKLQSATTEEDLKYQVQVTATTIQKTITGKASMKTFAEFVTGRIILLARVADATELKGIYDIHLDISSPRPTPGAGGARGGGGPRPSGGPDPFEEALRQQMGLDLTVAKVPTKLIVIDHAEKPTEN
jgi:uncharacterized protein (TIGR03435 family)